MRKPPAAPEAIGPDPNDRHVAEAFVAFVRAREPKQS